MKIRMYSGILVAVVLCMLAGCLGNAGHNPGTGDYNSTSPQTSQPLNTNDKEHLADPQRQSINIMAVGDIFLGRGVKTKLVQAGNNYDHVFSEVTSLLQKGDIVFGNLEAPATNSTHALWDVKKGGKYVLRNEPAAVQSLGKAGFNLISLANNHIMDYYARGLEDTIQELDKHNISFAGAGSNIEEARKGTIIECKGWKVGLLAYTDMAELYFKGDPQIRFMADEKNSGVAPRKLKYVLEDMERLRPQVDILLISLHWGIEESFEVTKAQVEFAHELIDAGADAILGHHPHQFQGIEMYKGKPILYSLGNFMFDQNDPENQESFIMEMKLGEEGLEGLRAIPVKIEGKRKIVLLEEQEAAPLLERQISLSEVLGAEGQVVGGGIQYSGSK